MNPIEMLNKLDLHDVPVLGINFFFQKKEIEIEYANYNEEKKLYEIMKLTFSKISSTIIEGSNEFIIDEIYDVSLNELIEGTQIEITFLMGAQKPSWKLGFVFKAVLIEPLGVIDI